MSSTAHRSFTHEPRSPDTGAYSVGIAVVHSRPQRSGWLARMPARLLGGTGRMLGVDTARGLAVVGLVFGAISSSRGTALLAVPLPWSAPVGLATTALFVVVAGMSVTLLLRGSDSVERGSGSTELGAGSAEFRADSAGLRAGSAELGADSAGLRAGSAELGADSAGLGVGPATQSDRGLTVAVRAVLLFAIGALASAIGGSAAPQLPVLLQLIGALSFCALFLQRWRARTLLIVAGLCSSVLPTIDLVLGTTTFADDTVAGSAAAVLHSVSPILTASAFPFLTWCGPFLAGLAFGRIRSDRLWRPFVMLASGGSLAALAIGGAVLADRLLLPASRLRELLGSGFTTVRLPSPGAVDTLDSITNGVRAVEVIGSCGVALTALALCLLLAKPLRWALSPLSALGSLALTASAALFASAVVVPMSSAQVLSLVHRAAPALDDGTAEVVTVAAIVAALCATATVWRLLLADGPVERAVSAFAALAVRSGAPRSGASEVLQPAGPIIDSAAASTTAPPAEDVHTRSRTPRAGGADPGDPWEHAVDTPAVDPRVADARARDARAGRTVRADEREPRPKRTAAAHPPGPLRSRAPGESASFTREPPAEGPVPGPERGRSWGQSAERAAQREARYGMREQTRSRFRPDPTAGTPAGETHTVRTPSVSVHGGNSTTNNRIRARNSGINERHDDEPRSGRLFGKKRSKEVLDVIDDEIETPAPVVDRAGRAGGASASKPPVTQWVPGQSLGRLPY